MEGSSSSPPLASPAVAKLKITGAWSGTVDVDLDTWTVQMLRAEVARRSNGWGSTRIKLICLGKVLKDGDSTLVQLGLENNSKVLAVLLADAGKGNQIEEESQKVEKLSKIWEAAKSMAERHNDGSFPLDAYNMELKNQDGKKVMLGSQSERRAFIMGLILHSNAKSLMRKQNYKDSLDVLAIAEEAFSLIHQKPGKMCNLNIVQMLIDGVSLLHLDMVWCYFMLRDISWLTVAETRLKSAREGFETSRSKDPSRVWFLTLRDTFLVENLAIYLRMDLLEGVVAYHKGNFKKALVCISSAQTWFGQLQVSKETLSKLIAMGFEEHSAKRAVSLAGEKTRDSLLTELEQRCYGRTPNKKAVDIEKVKQLASIGYERDLAAEALRINENDMEKALDILTGPGKNCWMQSNKESRRIRKSREMTAVTRPTTTDGAQFSATTLDPVVPAVRNAELGGPSGSPAAPDFSVGREENDDEMELFYELFERRVDPLADSDIDFTKEGTALAEYATLLRSVPGQL